MSLSPAAETLFDVLTRRASGTLELVAAHGQRASVSVHQGDVVDTRVGFAFQTVGQVLWQEGRMTPPQLDALWAAGEAGAPEEATLLQLGLEPLVMEPLHLRTQLRNLIAQAKGFQFIDGAVPAAPIRLSGALAVRAACEAAVPLVQGRWFQVTDRAGCVRWLSNVEETRWLEAREGFFSGDEVPEGHRALLVILERAGAVEGRDEKPVLAPPVPELVSQPTWEQAVADLSVVESLRPPPEVLAVTPPEEFTPAWVDAQVAQSPALTAEVPPEPAFVPLPAPDLSVTEDWMADEPGAQAAAAAPVESPAPAEVPDASAIPEAAAERSPELEAAVTVESVATLAPSMATEVSSVEAVAASAAPDASLWTAPLEPMVEEAVIEEVAGELPPTPAPLQSVDEEVFSANEAPRPILLWPDPVGATTVPASPAAIASRAETLTPAAPVRPAEPLPSFFSVTTREVPAFSIPRSTEISLELSDTSWGEMLDGPVTPAPAPASHTPPGVTPLTPPAPAPVAAAPPPAVAPLPPPAPVKRTQADLIREMNEALARAGAAPSDEWMAKGPSRGPVAPPPIVTAVTPAANPAPPPVQPETPTVPPAEAETVELSWEEDTPRLAARKASASAREADDDELWNLLQQNVSHDSVEQALDSVDAWLEALVNELPSAGEPAVSAAGDQDTELPEASIETTETTEPGDRVEADLTTSPGYAVDPELQRDTPGAITEPPVSNPPAPTPAPSRASGDDDELAGDPADQADAARQRRQRLMRRAMQNLGAFPPRKSGDTQPASRAPEPPPSVPERSTELTTKPPAPGPSADEAQLSALIEKRHAEVKAGIDSFSLLGLSRKATRDEVKAAFLNLAKVFHPDRLPPSLAALAPKMTGVFEAVREAYERLYDDVNRKLYLQDLEFQAKALAASPASPGQTADESFKKAEALFRKRDFVAAEELYAQAHVQKPSAVYLAARAWAIYMDPSRKADLPVARQMMTDALKLDPRSDRAHYQLGVISRVEGDMDRAEKHFRDAVTSNPKHLEAAQELRLVEMRKKNNPRKK